MRFLFAFPLVFSSWCCLADQSNNPAEVAPDAVAKSGCCSWHKGVCGCERGRAVCCDGEYSPTCGCHHDDNQDGTRSRVRDFLLSESVDDRATKLIMTGGSAP